MQIFQEGVSNKVVVPIFSLIGNLFLIDAVTVQQHVHKHVIFSDLPRNHDKVFNRSVSVVHVVLITMVRSAFLFISDSKMKRRLIFLITRIVRSLVITRLILRTLM